MQANGVKVKALDNRPDLLPGLDFYLNAFRELRYDRQIGMAVGPIPWSSIDRYAARHGIHGDDFDVLLSHIRAMENAAFAFDERRNKGKG